MLGSLPVADIPAEPHAGDMRKAADTFLELELTGDSVAGVLHDGERRAEAFSGWLEMVAVIEDARARRQAQIGPDPEPTRDQTPTRSVRAIDQ